MLLLSSVPAGVFAAGADYTAEEVSSDYFYRQLNNRAQAIYDKLLDEFSRNEDGKYYSGTEFIDLINLERAGEVVIDEEDVEAYKSGNNDIFNDFCAAKDALDLDHSELWWIDSGYLSFRVTEEDGNYHVLVGPGRGPTYLLGGLTEEEVSEGKDSLAVMDEAVNDDINAMVRTAIGALNSAPGSEEYSKQDQIAYLVRYIHDKVTKSIHYRYEIECHEPENGKFIRTLYGLHTHEGVCEAYSRTMQVALRRAGIECVLIHGLQTKGTPEDHMWNAVNIEDGGDHWYVVDATWDDPLVADYDGSRDLSFHYGDDGRETNTYLLVGQSVVGEHWRPSGIVSDGNFEFRYPTIETYDYLGGVAYSDESGLEVHYSAGGTTEDSVPAGVYSVKFQGMNAAQARDKGLYFMVKMYDYHPDGTSHVMQDWYYADAMFYLASDNDYFGDHPEGLRLYTSTCEYVEIAVTSREPDHRSDWSHDPVESYLSNYPEAGFFHGSESEIVAQTGLLYNVNSKYEAPPYVLTQDPAPSGSPEAGRDYRFRVTYDDALYHILPYDENAQNGVSPADAFTSDYALAQTQDIQVRYATYQQDLHNEGNVIATQVTGELPFDKNRDGIVDMDTDEADFRWLYGEDVDPNFVCPNEENHSAGGCDVEDGCPVYGVEFNFRASSQWIDDITKYNFAIEGLVGSRSAKFANNFSVIVSVPGLCPTSYRGDGIDWNLWGQPTLLDAPENLDLSKLAEEGTDPDILAKLDEQVNKSGLNGRLMLVVENKSKGAGNREEYEKIDGYLEQEENLGGEVLGSSVFEINFNRLCPAVNLKPNKGESLRVQVGYPAGITYEMLGSGEVELKAYHFTRCAESDPCGKQNEPGHKWGDDIVSVEEITIIPTPYGMVILCDAFSPFEIVAIEKDGGAEIAEAVNQSTLVVVSDPNGKVYVEGKEAVGEDGDVTFEAGETKTFTVQPKEGFVVDTVSLGGKEIEVQDDSFTVTQGEGGDFETVDVLSVTFLPEEVKESEAELGATVVPQVCTHPHTKEDSSDSRASKEPTCTEAGYARAQICTECGQTVVAAHEIPALGHTPITEEEGFEATCTEPGKTAHVTCEVCGETLSGGEEIPPKGHMFLTYEEGEANCDGLTLTATCAREGCTETDVKVDPSRAQHQYENGVCVLCGAKEPEPEKPNPPAKPRPSGSGSSGSSENKTVTNGEDGSKTVTTKHSNGSETVTTTTKDGVVGTTERSAKGEITSMQITVPASVGADETVTAPLVAEAAANSEEAFEIDVTVEGGGSVELKIPLEDPVPGIVAVLVHEDGTEEVVRDCVVDEDGLKLRVEGRVTLKLVDAGVDFRDMRGHWAGDAVQFVSARRLFNGTSEGVFSPKASMTRGMLVTVLHRLAYEPDAEEAAFRDVSSDAYYADAVAWAQQQGVVEGYDDGSFKPGSDVTREQMVTFLYRYADRIGAVSANGADLSDYADAGNVSAYAKEAVSWAVAEGLIRGTDPSHLSPASNASRAEVATILQRFCELLLR